MHHHASNELLWLLEHFKDIFLFFKLYKHQVDYNKSSTFWKRLKSIKGYVVEAYEPIIWTNWWTDWKTFAGDMF